MLKKLLKYDFKEMGTVLLPVSGALLLVSIVGKLLIETNVYNALPELFQLLGMAAYMLLIFACCIGAPIYFIIYFYKSFYSNTGYVIHTLPVTTSQKLVSKIISSFVYELMVFVLCILSVLIVAYDKHLFNDLANALQSADTEFAAMLGMKFTTFAILTGILLLISMFVQLLMFFASVSIGQLFKSHKVLGIIIGYLILNFASQIISSLLLVVLSGADVMYDTIPTAESIIALYGISGCMAVLQGAVFYLISYYFMEKKLNL